MSSWNRFLLGHLLFGTIFCSVGACKKGTASVQALQESADASAADRQASQELAALSGADENLAAAKSTPKADAGLPVFAVTLEDLEAFTASADASALLEPTNTRFYVVRSGDRAVSSVTLTKGDAGWELEGYGNAELASALATAQAAAGAAKQTLVDVPGLGIEILRLDALGQVTYVPLSDAYGLSAGTPVDGAKLFATLAPVAAARVADTL